MARQTGPGERPGADGVGEELTDAIRVIAAAGAVRALDLLSGPEDYLKLGKARGALRAAFQRFLGSFVLPRGDD